MANLEPSSALRLQSAQKCLPSLSDVPFRISNPSPFRGWFNRCMVSSTGLVGTKSEMQLLERKDRDKIELQQHQVSITGICKKVHTLISSGESITNPLKISIGDELTTPNQVEEGLLIQLVSHGFQSLPIPKDRLQYTATRTRDSCLENGRERVPMWNSSQGRRGRGTRPVPPSPCLESNDPKRVPLRASML